MSEAANSTNMPKTLSEEEKKDILKKLRRLIGKVLKNIQKMFESSDVHIMSEGDFEWHVANQINLKLKKSKTLRHFSVHTQVPWLCEKKKRKKRKFQITDEEVKEKNRRIDIAILDMTKFEPIDAEDIKQGLRYTGISFAIELKFIRPDTTVDNSEIDNDFAKRKSLEDDSWLYIVPLIDDSNGGYKEKAKAIKKMYKKASKERKALKKEAGSSDSEAINDIFFKPLIIHPFDSKERLEQIENK